MGIDAGDYVIVSRNTRYIPEFAGQIGKVIDSFGSCFKIAFNKEIIYGSRRSIYWDIDNNYLEKLNLNKRVKRVE